MNPWTEILDDFDLLELDDKKALVSKLQDIIRTEETAPVKTPLEEAWEDIQKDIAYLKREPYIDDQYEIEEAWNTCENLIKDGKLKDESWELREKILRDIIENNMYDYYGLMNRSTIKNMSHIN